MDTLLDLRKAGKIRYIGVSNLSPDQMDLCRGRGEIVSVQPPFSALDQQAVREVLPYCVDHMLGVLAYSPLAQGLLTGKVSPDRQFPPGDARTEKPLFSRENRLRVLALIEELRPWMDALEVTPAQFFLAWTVAQTGVTTAIAGARTPDQVLENAAAGNLLLPPEALEDARQALDRFRANS